MDQYTIDGKIEEVNYINKEKPILNKRLTIKQRFRLKYGYNEKVYCKDCKFFKKINVNDKHYYKCEKIGITSSQATDIRLKDYGCLQYIKEEDKKW